MISVLHVDDDTGILDLTRTFLERSTDIAVECVESARIALEKTARGSYDVIISDYQMPGMDGIEFLKHLRKTGDQTPFIIFTGKGREDVVIEAFDHGADYYIQKGGNPRAQYAELMQKIRKTVDLRRAKEARRESEEKYRLLVENANEAIVVVQESRIRFCNPRLARLLGRPPTDLDGLPVADFIHPDDRPLVMERQLRRTAGEDIPTNYQFRVVSSTGTVHWVLIHSSRIHWEGRPGLLVLLSDISAQKLAEEDLERVNEDLAAANEELTSQLETITRQTEDLHAAYEQLAATDEELRQNYQELEQSQALLSESEARYRLIVDAAQEGVWQMDGEMKTVFVNRAMARMLGYTEEEMLGRDIRDFIPVNERVEQESLIDLRRRGESARYERSFVRKDGTSLITSVSATPVIDDQGRFQGSFAMFTDITERKRAEEVLQRSEEWYAALFIQSAEGIFIHDIDGVILDVNQTAVSQTGYSRDELLQMTVFDLHTEESGDRDDILRQWHGWQPGQPATLETVHRRKDGTVFPVEVRTGVVRIGDGRYILALVRDITERKRAEEALQRSEEQYRVITENMTETISIMDLSMHFTYVSPSVETLRGFSATEAVQQSLDDVLTPESLQIARAQFNEEIRLEQEGGADPERCISLDLEEYHRDGSTVWVNNTMKFLRDEHGRPTSILIVSRDITARKLAEQAMRESEEKFRTIFENSPYPIAINRDPDF